MTANASMVRSMVVYGVCIPLAIILGYLLSNPYDPTTALTLLIVMGLLVLPLLLRWYHPWMITSWNMAITFLYLPGLLPGWMPVAGIGIVIAVGHYILNRDRKFLRVPSVTWSVIAVGLVVAITAKFRGGIGFRALGDENVGGKRYLWVWFAVIGYFVLISQPIPREKRRWYGTLFFLGGLTMCFGFIGSHLGPLAPVVNIFFPSGTADPQLFADPMANPNIERFGNFVTALVALAWVLVSRNGISGCLNFKKPWLPVLFFITTISSFFGGYRSLVIIVGFTLFFLFFFEGLWRTKLMPVVIVALLLGAGICVTFSDRLPLPVQRCLSLFPLKLNPEAALSAEASSEWRLEIWRFLIPQIPQYLLLGKGLTFDANDMAINMTMGAGVTGDPGGQLTLAGDYHNGPLSVVIPFGIWGCLAFLWFLWASFRALLSNFKYGDPEIRTFNAFLLAYFLAKVVVFFFVFGGFVGDFASFVGLIGLSIALNAGVAKPVEAPEVAPAIDRPRVALPFRARPAISR